MIDNNLPPDEEPSHLKVAILVPVYFIAVTWVLMEIGLYMGEPEVETWQTSRQFTDQIPTESSTSKPPSTSSSNERTEKPISISSALVDAIR